MNVPSIQANPKCRKCHGTSIAVSRKGQTMPCARCYSRNGYCKKCFGTGYNYRKNKPCKKCHNGKMKGYDSCSSSWSD